MMTCRKVYFFLLCLLTFAAAQSQSAQFDSLIQVIETMESAEDRYQALEALKQDLGSFGEEVRFAVTERLITEARLTERTPEVIDLTVGLAIHKVNSYETEKADSLLKTIKSFHPFTSDLDDFHRMRYWYGFGYLKERQIELDSALYYFNLAREAFDPTGVGFDQGFIYGDMVISKGQVESALGQFGASSQSLNEAMEIFREIGDSIGVSYALNELSILYSMLGLYDEAERYINEKADFVEEGPADRAGNYVNTGRNRILEKEFDAAIEALQSGLALIEDIKGDPRTDFIRMYLYNGLIEAAFFSGQTDSLDQFLAAQDSAFNGIGRDEEFAFMLRQSSFLVALSKGDFETAEPLGKQLFKDSRAKNDPAEIAHHADFLNHLYRAKGDYQEALTYADIHNSIRDSLNTANKTGALLLYQTQLETVEKENRISELASDKKLANARSQLFGIIAISLASLLLIGLFLFQKLRKARAQLETQNTQLEALNSTKDRFFGIIGHDLRSPLVALDGVDEQMQFYAEKGDMGKLQRVSKMVGNTAKQLTGLLDNLLSWAMTQSGTVPYNPEPVSLKGAIEEIAALLGPNAERKQIRLGQQIKGDPIAMVDRNALSSVLRNLLSNAIKHTGQGGGIEILCATMNDKVSIEVRDNGVGMTEEQLSKLFSLEAKNSRGTAGEKGTGLGLLICRDFVQQNKGSISVQSRPGEGSSFVVVLPAAG